MKLWNGYRWLEYSGAPPLSAVLSTSSPPAVLDPAIQVVTDDGAVPLVEQAHAAFRAQLEIEEREVSEPTSSKLPGELPTPIATFNFDTSDEEN